jgi:hypothetical protein
LSRENVGASTSQQPYGLSGPVQGQLFFSFNLFGTLTYLIIVSTGTDVLLDCECAASALGTSVSVQSISAPQFCKHFLPPVAFSGAQLEMSCQF